MLIITSGLVWNEDMETKIKCQMWKKLGLHGLGFGGFLF